MMTLMKSSHVFSKVLIKIIEIIFLFINFLFYINNGFLFIYIINHYQGYKVLGIYDGFEGLAKDKVSVVEKAIINNINIF